MRFYGDRETRTMAFNGLKTDCYEFRLRIIKEWEKHKLGTSVPWNFPPRKENPTHSFCLSEHSGICSNTWRGKIKLRTFQEGKDLHPNGNIQRHLLPRDQKSSAFRLCPLYPQYKFRHVLNQHTVWIQSRPVPPVPAGTIHIKSETNI